MEMLVRDNGRGIQSENKEQVFGLFKLSHTGKAHSGTGVGLSICQRIVDRYNGRIWVESEPGLVSTFLFARFDVHFAAAYSIAKNASSRVMHCRQPSTWTAR